MPSLDQLPNLKTAFARILSAKPHSTDVERLISCSVALKSTSRSRMLLETENLNLYVHYNMPAVICWMNERERQNRDCRKGKQQQYFKGVFSEASHSSLTSGETLTVCQEEPVNKKKKTF